MSKSVLKRAIEEIVGLSLISHNDLEIKIYSYKNDFDYLWDFEQNKNDSLLNWIQQNKDKEQTIIIIWDGIPAENKEERIAEYLTPFDWALACSYLLLENASKADEIPNLRIFIFDISSDKKTKKAFSYNAFQIINSALPWIQIYSPIVKDINSNELIALQLIKYNNDESVRYFRPVLPLGMLGTVSLLEDLFSLNTTFSLKSAQEETDRKQTLKTLIEIWRSKLLSPENRHHIGNIIAPTVLSKGLPNKLQQKYFQETQKVFPLLNAVKSLVKVLELETQKVSSSSFPISDDGLLNELVKDKKSIFDRRKNIKFLLIDDQYELGFHHILANILFGKNYQSITNFIGEQSISELNGNNGKLFCEKNADNLFVILEQMSSVKKNKEPNLLKQPHSCDVLLLDLRLWTNETERKRFFDRLIDVCARIKDKNLVDDQMYSTAYNAARKLNSKRVDKGNELEAIALLPLLLSYFDPSLPIILFSSTHQRKVSKMLSHRLNIITDFSKPIFSGYNEEDSPADLIAKLKKSLKRSVLLFESRIVWERLCAKDSAGAYLFNWNSLPVFEFLNNGQSEVYNSNQNNLPRRNQIPRVNNGRLFPKLIDTDLRSKLADIYYNYIVGENFYDFFTILYELIESSLVPDSILNKPDVTNTSFLLPHKFDDKNYVIENYVIKVCVELRNKKAHGNTKFPESSEEKENYRLFSIILFLFFLDFLEGRKISIANFYTELLGIERKLRTQPTLANISNLEPHKLNNNKQIAMLDYFSFLTTYSASKANNGVNTFLSLETVNAVKRLSNLVLSRP